MSIGNSLESLSQAILVGVMSVGGLGIAVRHDRRAIRRSQKTRRADHGRSGDADRRPRKGAASPSLPRSSPLPLSSSDLSPRGQS